MFDRKANAAKSPAWRWLVLAAAAALASTALFVLGSRPERSSPQALGARPEQPEAPPTEKTERSDARPSRSPSGREERDRDAERDAAAEALIREYFASIEAPPAASAIREEEYRSLREPVIAALRRLDGSRAQRHGTMVRALEDSGPSSEPWTYEAASVFATWAGSMPPDVSPRMGEPQCFRAGCLLRISYANMQEYEAAADLYRRIKDEGLPHGGRMLLPPRPNAKGEIETGWVMLRPRPDR